MPLPPYILKQREVRGEGVEDEGDGARYQTVYAHGGAGSVAAPTAGLHFTDRVLEGLDARGVVREEVELHVGIGTFRPIESETLEGHVMHSEWCSMGSASVRVAGGKPGGGRVIGVGSTSVRTLESYARVVEAGGSVDAPIETDIMIAPGYGWRWVDGMVTNFHLPRSTLIAMVAAALETEGVDGVARVRAVYAHAIRAGYRFYSYGDAMLILP
jgi:S-adenosylmethionine:tRNA ribosyltransferase-isomerase